MLTSFIRIDGKYHLICNWNDMQIKIQFVLGAQLNIFLMDVGFILRLMAWLQVVFLQG